MTSYLSTLNNILSTTTSRYNSLRRNILSSSSEDDANLDHADNSHVTRVLRAYYTEKGRPLPGWLPPDPRAPPPSAPQAYVARPLGSLRSQNSSASIDSVSRGRTGGSGGGLGDIWGDSAAAVPTRDDGPQSLRRAAAVGNRRAGLSQTVSSNDVALPTSSMAGLTVRPLPSQRAGSYQTTTAAGGASSFPNRYLGDDLDGFGAGGGGGGGGGGSGSNSRSSSATPSGLGSGRDRLKARLGSQRVVAGSSGASYGSSSGNRYADDIDSSGGRGDWQPRR